MQGGNLTEGLCVCDHERDSRCSRDDGADRADRADDSDGSHLTDVSDTSDDTVHADNAEADDAGNAVYSADRSAELAGARAELCGCGTVFDRCADDKEESR